MAQERGPIIHGLADSCGCAMGAIFMVAGLLIGSVYYGWQVHLVKLTLYSALLHVFVTTFLAAGIGKLVGISRYLRIFNRAD